MSTITLRSFQNPEGVTDAFFTALMTYSYSFTLSINVSVSLDANGRNIIWNGTNVLLRTNTTTNITFSQNVSTGVWTAISDQLNRTSVINKVRFNGAPLAPTITSAVANGPNVYVTYSASNTTGTTYTTQVMDSFGNIVATSSGSSPVTLNTGSSYSTLNVVVDAVNTNASGTGTLTTSSSSVPVITQLSLLGAFKSIVPGTNRVGVAVSQQPSGAVLPGSITLYNSATNELVGSATKTGLLSDLSGSVVYYRLNFNIGTTVDSFYFRVTGVDVNSNSVNVQPAISYKTIGIGGSVFTPAIITGSGSSYTYTYGVSGETITNLFDITKQYYVVISMGLNYLETVPLTINAASNTMSYTQSAFRTAHTISIYNSEYNTTVADAANRFTYISVVNTPTITGVTTLSSSSLSVGYSYTITSYTAPNTLRIEASTTSNFTKIDASGMATFSGSNTGSIILSDLSSSTTYFVRARVSTPLNVSSYSTSGSGSTLKKVTGVSYNAHGVDSITYDLSSAVAIPTTGNTVRNTSTNEVVSSSVSGTQLTVTGLSEYTTYTFYVDLSGFERFTTPSARTKDVTAPGDVSGFTSTPGNGQIDLSWTELPQDAGSDISGYYLYEGTSGSTVFRTVNPKTDTHETVTGLTNGTSYVYRIAAFDVDGNVGNTRTVSATPRTVPSAPTITSVVAGNAQLAVSWTPGNNGGAAITAWKVVEGTNIYTVSSDQSSYTITNLTNGTSYTIAVYAVNEVGNGAEATSTGTPVAPSAVVPCFFGNAPVLTASGYRRMDSLRAGDKVMTPEGAEATVERVKVTQCTTGPLTNPYIIPKGRFGAERRVLISPNHKVVTSEGMVEAKDLGLEQEAREGSLTYYNLELTGQANMVVGGVAVESLAPVRRITMTMGQFKAALQQKYGNISANVLANVQRTCRILADGRVEVPVLRR